MAVSQTPSTSADGTALGGGQASEMTRLIRAVRARPPGRRKSGGVAWQITRYVTGLQARTRGSTRLRRGRRPRGPDRPCADHRRQPWRAHLVVVAGPYGTRPIGGIALCKMPSVRCCAVARPLAWTSASDGGFTDEGRGEAPRRSRRPPRMREASSVWPTRPLSSRRARSPSRRTLPCGRPASGPARRPAWASSTNVRAKIRYSRMRRPTFSRSSATTAGFAKFASVRCSPIGRSLTASGRVLAERRDQCRSSRRFFA